MREYQNKKAEKGRLHSPLVLALLVFLLVSLVLGIVKIYPRSREALRLNAEAKDEKQKIVEREKGLEEEVKKLQTVTGQEEVIRKRFSVKKPGEEVLVILDKDSQSAKVSNDSGNSFFIKIWAKIKSIF